jgi:exonuclease III
VWKVDIVCLQETKMQNVTRELVQSLWGCNQVDWCALGSQGASGGILLMWDRRVVEKVEDWVGCFSVACSFRSVSDDFRWAFAGVYGPNIDSDRLLLWDELSNLMDRWEVPWCIGGDFNAIRFPSERLGNSRFVPAMEDFSRFIFDRGLVDIPLRGGQYTWSNGHSWSRIDRFLLSSGWEEKYSNVAQKRLTRVMSDHFPISLESEGSFRRGGYFKFENMWLKFEGFVELVERWWKSYQFFGDPSYVLAQKLKALKGDLSRWNNEVFGHVGKRIKAISEEIMEMDSLEEERGLDEEDKRKKASLSMELERLLLCEEISWRQKSRALWLKEGDKNTKFFHRVANSNRRVNSIDSLSINGVVSYNHDEIKDHMVQFYSTLFTENGGWRLTPKGMSLKSIGEEDCRWLEKDFEESEVWEVVKKMKDDKAPGPDGFSMGFVKVCWRVIKEDVMAVFGEFHSKASFQKSLNATFIALIPKKVGAVDLKDFRPISLVGVVYKLIAKVLANRLKKVLGKITSLYQNAFVKGRQILDSVLIGNECIDSRIRSGIPGLLCKLDLEKAYDHVNWNFLLLLLHKCGFGEKWRDWIAFCISSVRYSVLVNGEPAGFFSSSRGIRQGDPLSPLLFVIVMEALSTMMKIAEDRGLVTGFSVGPLSNPGLSISHLLFADDTLVFCDADEEQLRNLRCFFFCFEAASGLRINLSKSEIVPIGEVPDIGRLASIFDCKVVGLHMKYLGLPLGAYCKSPIIWNDMLEITERRLAGWKRGLLSKGGRLTLIKSTLSNMPTYMMSLFPIPVNVANKMESMQRKFLWGSSDEEKKFHLVNWSLVCSPIQNGGLGIRNIHRFNQALLGKWLWRFAMESEALWRKVVEIKYGSLAGGWCTKQVEGSFGVGVWKHIRRGWESFSKFIKFEVGDGSRIRFWHDI